MGNQEVLSAAIYASNPDLNDPLDLAIFRYAKQQNITLDLSTVIKRYPFTEDRKKETVQLLQHTFSKGAPETIFNLCTMDAQSRNSWENTVSTLAKQGHKVLAVAKRDCEDIDFLREDAADFTLLGLLAFEDPPRPEVKEAITYCHNQGIKVLMITGDHPDTALAIGSEIGLGEKVLNAESEFSFFENGSWDFIQSIDIVARCTPMQKLKIVNRLKQDKKIVVVTGDGVNDVPALKTAHIGVVMGLRGVRSAKEVSSIIISDDNFATIIAAIQEGKKLFYNLKLSFHYLLLVHIPLVLISALVPLLGYPLVFSPIQIVLLELLIHPSAFLGFQGEVNFFSSKDLQLFPLKDVLKIIGSGVLVSFILLSCYILLIQYSQKNLVQVRDIIVSLLMLWSGLSVLHLNRYKNSPAPFFSNSCTHSTTFFPVLIFPL